MKKNTTRFAAFLTAFLCAAGLASCGRDVETAKDESQGGFNVVGGTGITEDSEADPVVTTAPATDEAAAVTSTTNTSDGFSAVTRSQAEIDSLKKPTGSGNSTPKKPSGGSTGGTTGGSAGGTTGGSTGGSTGGGNSGNNGSGGNTGNGGVSGITLSYYTAEIMVGQTKTYPVVSQNITEVWTSSDTNVATVDSVGNITGVGEGSCTIKVTSASNSSVGAEVAVTVKAAAQGTQVIDGVTYVSGILIANKSYGLPSTYNPGGLTSDTQTAFNELAQGAANDGLSIYVSSGFRSYESQDQIYNNYVWTNGQDVADTFSARPGYSEHQTGLAIDVNEISDAFIGTPEAIWLEEHCYEYGFIIRYPQGKQGVTGYKYEPWHIRYVGKQVAQAVHDAAASVGDPYLTLEEYLGIDSYYH